MTTAAADIHGRDLTVPEAAARLGVSDRTMRRIIARGEIPYTKPSRHPRISPAAVEAYRQSVAVGGAPTVVLTAPEGDDPLAAYRR